MEQKAKGNGQTCLPHEVLAALREVAGVEGLPTLNQLERALPATR